MFSDRVWRSGGAARACFLPGPNERYANAPPAAFWTGPVSRPVAPRGRAARLPCTACVGREHDDDPRRQPACTALDCRDDCRRLTAWNCYLGPGTLRRLDTRDRGAHRSTRLDDPLL